MKRKRIVRTAEVTIETEEDIILRGGTDRRTVLTWCPSCRREVEMVTAERAAQVAGVSTRTIYRWIESGSVHFIERFGDLRICFSALRVCIAKRKEDRVNYENGRMSECEGQHQVALWGNG